TVRRTMLTSHRELSPMPCRTTPPFAPALQQPRPSVVQRRRLRTGEEHLKGCLASPRKDWQHQIRRRNNRSPRSLLAPFRAELLACTTQLSREPWLREPRGQLLGLRPTSQKVRN